MITLVFKRALAAGAALLALQSTAYAADRNDEHRYLGLGLGGGSATDLCSKFSGGSADSFDCEKNFSAFKIFAGYRFNPYVALEASYQTFGKAKLNGHGPFEGEVLEFDGHAYGLAALGHVPIGERVSLFAKAGAAHWRATASYHGPGQSEEESDSSVSFLGGAGVNVYFSESFGMRAEIDVIRNVGKEEHFRSDVRTLWLSLMYRF